MTTTGPVASGSRERTVTAAPVLHRVDGSTSLREQVADALRAALVAGQLEPGAVYSAPALAAQLGVSATPVREAMLDLSQQGLVEPVRNKGFRVSVLSDRELDEITEVRELIEIPVMGKIARAAGSTRIELLRPAASAIVEAAGQGDLIGYIDADLRFHLQLLGLHGNEHLVEQVRHLRLRSRLYGLVDMAETGQLVDSAAEHLTLLDALVAGDGDGAERAMRHHMGHVRGKWASKREPAPHTGRGGTGPRPLARR